jgi:hypothetical protein
MASLAFYTTLDNAHGVALRLTDGTVHCQADDPGLWTQLYDQDVPRLHLHGRVDLATAQALEDGDLVLRASRTLRRAA